MWASTNRIDCWLPATLVNPLTTKLLNHLTAKLEDRLAAKLVVVNSVTELHLTKWKWLSIKNAVHI